MPNTLPRFLNVGERALCVELGNAIDDRISRQVLELDLAVQAARVSGIVETVPTYRSLLIAFDPDMITRAELTALVMQNWPPVVATERAVRRWHVPVRYGDEHGADLEHVAELHGLTPDELIALHSAPEYRVVMIGFSPGFAYLSGLPERIHTSRRKEPRLRTPPGSISIGGQQAAIASPLEAPSGWQLLGRTPVRSYDPRRSERPFLFSPGDLVRFHPISLDRFEALSAQAAEGSDVADVVHE